jgi:MraZ protein
VLIGQYEANISSKRRVAIPKKFVSQLGKKVIIARWYEQCLVLVSEDDWKMILDKLTGKSDILTTPVRDTDRFIMGSAFETVPDNQGRVVIPELLRKYAKLKTELIFLGLGNRVEIWDKEDWIKREKIIQDNAVLLLEEYAKSKEKDSHE